MDSLFQKELESEFRDVDLNNPLIKEQLNRVLADWRLTPATFAHRISRGKWIAKDHLAYISMKIAQGVARGGARIIISAPPRHGKSQLASIYTPAWVLERYPNKQVILASYGAELAVGFGRQVRDIFTDSENQGLLKVRLRRDTQKVAAFLTDHGGGMYSVGMGGAITGRGAHVLLIDDYIKELKEALSPAYRDTIYNWFTTVAFTRLEPGGSCIIIATRWHSDDLIGRLLTNFPGQWEYIELPAQAYEDDILGRAPGEPLFPERYPTERLTELKETLGSLFYEALFQQRPVDESKKISDGSWLKIIPYADYEYVAKRHHMKHARVWDLAATEDGGDYTAGTLVAYDKDMSNFYILDVKRGQWGPKEVETHVYDTAQLDGLDIPVYIEQEPGSAGKSLVEHYAANVLKDFSVKPVPTTTKKVIRAQPFLAAAEHGKVYLVEGKWNNAFVKEFDTFPGAFDDQVDTAAAGYTQLSGKKAFSASWGRSTSGRTANSNRIKREQGKLFKTSRPRSNRLVRGATFGRRS